MATAAASAVSITEVPVLPQPASIERLLTAPDGRILFPSGPGYAFGAPGPPGLGAFDPANGQAAILPLPSRPFTIASAAGSIWLTTPSFQQQVSSQESRLISRVDPQTGQILATVDAGQVADLAASPDGATLYASRGVSGPTVVPHGEVVAIDTATLAVSAPLVTTYTGSSIGVASDGALWYAEQDPHSGIVTATLTRRDPNNGSRQTYPTAAPANVSEITAGDHGDVWVRVNRGTGFPGTPVGDYVGHADPSQGPATAEATPPVDDAIISTLVLGPDGGVWYDALTKTGSFVIRVDRASLAQSAIPVPSAGNALKGSTRSADGASLWFAGFGTTTNFTHVTFSGDATTADAASVAKGGLQTTFACPAACSASAALTGPAAAPAPRSTRAAARAVAASATGARAPRARRIVYARTLRALHIAHATKAHGLRLATTAAGRRRMSRKGTRIVSTLRIRIRQGSRTRTIVRTIGLALAK